MKNEMTNETVAPLNITIDEPDEQADLAFAVIDAIEAIEKAAREKAAIEVENEIRETLAYCYCNALVNAHRSTDAAEANYHRTCAARMLETIHTGH